jgi:hypothetical protein
MDSTGARKLPVIIFVYGGVAQVSFPSMPVTTSLRPVELSSSPNIRGFPTTNPVGGIDQNPGNTYV